jgi:hypothetical protein
MTTEERVRIITDFGFSERQARFLELVMRHSGVCVPRQYATFASIAKGGEKCNALFDKLTRRGYAVACDCIHNRARLYHVRHKPLYRAIDEQESRHRRPISARRAVEQLMLLDAVLETPGLTWLTTPAEKVLYCAGLSASPSLGDHPAAGSPDGLMRPAAFRATFTIGLDPTGRAVLFYLATDVPGDDFRLFLQTHADFLRATSAWTLRLVFPRPLDRLYNGYQHVVHEELETPLHRARVNELRWYFEHRQKATQTPPDAQTKAFLDRATQVYGRPRFALLYRRWLREGDAVFNHLSSPTIAEALAGGTARVESLVLPHTYGHLSPVVNRLHRPPERLEKAAAYIGPPMSSTSSLL